MQRSVELGGKTYTFDWWKGEVLKGTAERPLAIDLETRVMRPARQPLEGEELNDVPPDPLDVPEPALGMASSGDQSVLIHPSQFEKFLLAHRAQHVVGHNLQFDFHVLLRNVKAITAKNVLWEWGDRGYLHDTVILDLLLQLATGNYRHSGKRKKSGGDDEKVYTTNLGVLTAEWGVGELDKEDPYRLRFGELIGLSQEEIDAHPEADRFLSYAIKDVIATYYIWPKQRLRALELMMECGWSSKPQQRYEIRPDAVEKFGVLSERIQVLASIVLAELSRTPVRIDQQRRDQMERECRDRYNAALELLLQREPELLKKSKPKYKTIIEGKGKNKTKRKELVKVAEVLYTKKTGVPQFDQKKLTAVLEAEAVEMKVPLIRVVGGKSKVEVLDPETGKVKKVGVISTSAKEWKVHQDKSDFIKAWCSLESETKHLQFLTALNAPEIYSRYDLMKTTGRTSAGAFTDYKRQLLVPSLNIQQVPRDSSDSPEDNLRPLFLAPKGHLWLAVDYSYLEFRAMAAVAMARFGKSVMAKVTLDNTKSGGPDPHQFLAANMLGIGIGEFFQLDPKKQKYYRQQAKLGNFGLMSGMSKETFVDYAAAAGTSLSYEQAAKVKKAFMDTYVEMREYLDEDLARVFLWGCKPGTKFPYNLTKVHQMRLVKFLKQDRPGQLIKLTEDEEELFWDVLEWAAHRKGCDQTIEDVQNRKLTSRVRKLSHYRAATLTGLIRNYTTYTAQRNTNFQSISAAGAKLALWNLYRRGYKLLNFVHDEIGVAVEIKKAAAKQREVERIMVAAMETVFGQGVPVAVGSELAQCWSKG